MCIDCGRKRLVADHPGDKRQKGADSLVRHCLYPFLTFQNGRQYEKTRSAHDDIDLSLRRQIPFPSLRTTIC
jgi:hypothetical protein